MRYPEPREGETPQEFAWRCLGYGSEKAADPDYNERVQEAIVAITIEAEIGIWPLWDYMLN